MKETYFLPYQQQWLNDTAPVKIWEKSRRIGATYTQSYEDVRDALSGTVKAVWFSSADESAAKEYILYCLNWCKMFALAGGKPENELMSSVQTHSIEFVNGSRITALSSNPKGFRSKGGKVVLDEFAHHADQHALWKAARPAVTWGFPVRIISTHNGRHSLFIQFVDSVKQGSRNWKLHTTDIYTAAKQGLINRILKKTAGDSEKEEFLNALRKDCFDETAWLEEYCCIPVDEKTAFLPYDKIRACSGVCPEFANNSLPFVLGADIARKGDSTVLWALAINKNNFITIDLVVLSNTSFAEQKDIITRYCTHPLFRKMCIDSTGIGIQLAEELITMFGANRVEAVSFTPQVKETLAYTLWRMVNEQRVLLPDSPDVADDLHSIRKEVTAAGNTRLNAERINGSHGDRFWALTLALHAATNAPAEVFVSSKGKRNTLRLKQHY